MFSYGYALVSVSENIHSTRSRQAKSHLVNDHVHQEVLRTTGPPSGAGTNEELELVKPSLYHVLRTTMRGPLYPCMSL